MTPPPACGYSPPVARTTSIVIVLLLALPAGAWQEDQRPRQPSKDTRGLLGINKDFYDLSANTGGDFYYWAAGEFATAALTIPTGGEDIVLAYGAVDGSRTTFEIPVESGARELAVFCGVQRKDLALLFHPDGTLARDGAGGVRLQSYQHMLIAQVIAPAPGVWKLELTGLGMSTVTARVKPAGDRAAPGFDSFELVEMRGRPGHEGWFPIKRNVKKGETIDCKATLSGSVFGAVFELIARDGSVIAAVPMKPVGSDGDYHARCAIPSSPFRVSVSGRDAAGAPFRRIGPGVRTPD